MERMGLVQSHCTSRDTSDESVEGMVPSHDSSDGVGRRRGGTLGVSKDAQQVLGQG